MLGHCQGNLAIGIRNIPTYKGFKGSGSSGRSQKGYYMHYNVNRHVLEKLSIQIKELAEIEGESCNPQNRGCESSEQKRCHLQESSHRCSNKVKTFCPHEDGEEG